MMNEKFPYGYDVNAYIDKAFERMKADFPWATREMITKDIYIGIEKVGDDYEYVSYLSMGNGKTEIRPLQVDCEEFINRLASGHEWGLEMENPVEAFIDVPASCRCSGDWFLETYQIRKHKKGGYSTHVQAGNRSAGGSRTFFIPASYLKLPWEEFLDKYLELVSPGPFYVGWDDMEKAPGLKEFLGYENA